MSLDGSALVPVGNQQNVASLEVIEPHPAEDPDELQLLDECDSRWVEAWKIPAKQSTELMVRVIYPLKHVRA